MDIYVQKDGQKLGPYPELRIRQGIDAGEFTAEDLAWTKGRAEWQPLSALIGLDLMLPPPISTSVASADVVGLSKSPSAAPPSGDRIETPPAVEGRWKRQHNCKKCDAPFKTFTVGTLKATDICDVCAQKRSRLIGACFAVVVVAIFVADKILEREHEDLKKKANAYVSSLGNPKPQATPNDNAFLFPTVTPSPVTSSSGLRMEMRRHMTEPMVFPTIPPLADSPEEAADVLTAEQHVGLRKDEATFLAFYGKIHGSALGPPEEPPGAKADSFYASGLYYLVVFWDGVAQDVLVTRKDGKEFTEEDIRSALDTYAEGKVWRSATVNEAGAIRHWERDGAIANLGKHNRRGNPPEANNPDEFLQIATPEYVNWHNRHK